MKTGETARALADWQRYRSLHNAQARCQGLEILLARGQLPQATELVNELKKMGQKIYEVCGPVMNRAFGLYEVTQGRAGDAIPFFEVYYAHAPADPQNYRALTAAYGLAGQMDNSTKFAAYLDKVVGEEQQRLLRIAGFFEEKGLAADAKALRQVAERL